MIARGWDVRGVEPSASAVASARARGVDVVEGTLSSIELEPDALDAIIFNHSLEHIPAPVEALASVRAGLRPGGLVAISVPNFDCWARRRFGREWFHLDLPRHRVHFTQRALTVALERAGLEARRTWTTTSPSGLAGSVQYRRLGGLAVDEGAARKAVGQVAGLALLPIARTEQALGGGRDFLHAIARRRRPVGPTLPRSHVRNLRRHQPQRRADPRPRAQARGDERADRPPRPRRRGPVDPRARPRRPRPPAPQHHRPDPGRAPADVRRGGALDHLQRRGLQLPRAAHARSAADRSAPAATPRSSCARTTAGAPAPSSGCAACSPTRSGTSPARS